MCIPSLFIGGVVGAVLVALLIVLAARAIVGSLAAEEES